MNLQEIFDKVSKHLLTQMEVSYLEDGFTCAYRGENGRKCAVGCLIPDELYTRKMEKNTIRLSRKDNQDNLWPILEKLNFTDRDTLSLLLALQSVHDNMDPPSWRDGLDRVAYSFDLTCNF